VQPATGEEVPAASLAFRAATEEAAMGDKTGVDGLGGEGDGVAHVTKAGETGNNSDVSDGEDGGSGEGGAESVLGMGERCRSISFHYPATVWPHTNTLLLSLYAWRVVKL
jgi:hypothetical protein